MMNKITLESVIIFKYGTNTSIGKVKELDDRTVTVLFDNDKSKVYTYHIVPLQNICNETHDMWNLFDNEKDALQYILKKSN